MNTDENQELNLDQDVQVIREILFGNQMRTLKEKIEVLEAENTELASSLEQERKRHKKAEGDLKKEMLQLREQVDALEKSMGTHLEQSLASAKKAHQDDFNILKQSVEAQLKEMQKNDSDQRFKLENLVATLATSLKNYSEDETPRPVNGE